MKKRVHFELWNSRLKHNDDIFCKISHWYDQWILKYNNSSSSLGQDLDNDETLENENKNAVFATSIDQQIDHNIDLNNDLNNQNTVFAAHRPRGPYTAKPRPDVKESAVNWHLKLEHADSETIDHLRRSLPKEYASYRKKYPPPWAEHESCPASWKISTFISFSSFF